MDPPRHTQLRALVTPRSPLSRLEARVALADLLGRARDFVPASDEPWPPRQPFHVHGPASLPIRFRRR